MIRILLYLIFIVTLLVTLILQYILLLCLVLAEMSKPCIQFSLPKFVLLSLVSQIFLLKKTIGKVDEISGKHISIVIT